MPVSLQVLGTHAALLPHELFACLRRYPELFEAFLTGPDRNLERFWASSAGSEWFGTHPVHQIRDAPNLAIPIGTYGDDAGI
eukprot:5385555-Alexandrium_andersonii.AAC.1